MFLRKTSVDIQRITRRYIPEDGTLQYEFNYYYFCYYVLAIVIIIIIFSFLVLFTRNRAYLKR
jgi:hypothetical protein